MMAGVPAVPRTGRRLTADSRCSPDLPAEQSRVLDFVNQDQPFLTLRDGDVHHLVCKSQITRVTEARD